MRLLRLVSEDPTGLFNCDFNTEVLLPPHSSIALESLTANIDRQDILITPDDSELSYSVNGPDSVKTIQLMNGPLNRTNQDAFFSDMTLKLNKSLGATDIEYGKQWLCGVQQSRATLQCKRGTVVSPKLANTTSLLRYTNASTVLNAPTGEFVSGMVLDGPKNDMSWMTITAPYCNGAGLFQASPFTDGGNTQFTLGLMAEWPAASDTVLNEQDIAFGVCYNSAGNKYQYIYNGTRFETDVEANFVGTASDQNDIVGISSTNGQVELFVRRGDDFPGDQYVVLNNAHYIPWTHQLRYYPVAVFNGNIGCAVYNIFCTTDPYAVATTTKTPTPQPPHLKIITGQTRTLNMLEWGSSALASVFGFKNTRTPNAPNVYTADDDIEYTADNVFVLSRNTEAYIVELLNLRLDSYDSQSQQRRSFLHVLPNASEIETKLIYVANNLIFLDLNNKDTISLRNLKLRILTQGLDTPLFFGQTQIVLLVQ